MESFHLPCDLQYKLQGRRQCHNVLQALQVDHISGQGSDRHDFVIIFRCSKYRFKTWQMSIFGIKSSKLARPGEVEAVSRFNEMYTWFSRCCQKQIFPHVFERSTS